MALKDTMNHMKKILEELAHDLHKAETGNKAASQRVRTGSIRLEKCAKVYRKESVVAEKKGGKAPKKAATKAKAKPAKKPAGKKPAAKAPAKRK